MATKFAPLTAQKLLTHPLMLSIGSLSMSTFMSQSVYGIVDWRPVVICVAADILAIGTDHYVDQKTLLSYALETGNGEITDVFRQAKILLYSGAAMLLFALALSPPWTWLMVTLFFGPAFVWDLDLMSVLHRKSGSLKKRAKMETECVQKVFTIKRIPGTKAIFVGIIRGCGTFAIVNSILSHTIHTTSAGPTTWNPIQIVLWSTVNRACHAVMADVRDFREDWEKKVPTVPVLLKSVVKTKLLLTFVHVLTASLYHKNPYIIFASVYAIVLVWLLDEDSPRGLFRLSFHSQTLTALLYGAVELAKSSTVSYRAV